MALTESKMLPLGTRAPKFKLEEPGTKTFSLDDFAGANATLIMFICNHCPYVKHIDPQLSKVTSDFMKRGVAVIGINSNDADNYPEDGPEMMIKEKRVRGYQFPYLFDNTQEVARAYDAACTPDFYLFDRDLKLVYRGQMDGSRPGNKIEVTGEDLIKAVDATLLGKPFDSKQRPSVGCNIKWK